MFPRMPGPLRALTICLSLTVCIIALTFVAEAQVEDQPAATASAAPESAGSESVGSASAVAQPKAKPRTDDPVSFGIVVDESDAVRGKGMLIRDAVARLSQALREDDEAFVISVKGRPELAQDFTSDGSALRQSVDKLETRGNVALYDGILNALGKLDEAENDRKALVVIASGFDDASRTPLEEVLKRLNTTPSLAVYCLALGKEKSDDVLQKLTANRGELFSPKREWDVRPAVRKISTNLFGDGDADKPAKGQKALAKYKGLVVRSIPVVNGPGTQEFPGGDNLLLKNLIIARLRAKNIFPSVIDGADDNGADAALVKPSTPGTYVEMLPSIVEYKQGSRVKREFFGFGSGAARVRVRLLFRDAATGKIVMRSEQEANGASGLFGGNKEKQQTEAMLRVVNQVVAEIARNR